jgi:hypothetical protein
MSTQIVLKVLALRHRLRQRGRWTRRQLEEYQSWALRLVREHACPLIKSRVPGPLGKP